MTNKKTALITGATGGIGSEVARKLDALGYHLILLGTNKIRTQALADEMQSASAMICNLANPAEVEGLCEQLDRLSPPLDIAFINAGIISPGDILDCSTSDINRMLEINFCIAIHLIKACASNMQRQKSGHIIASVSMGGILSLKGSAVYSATKFGLRGFLTGIKDELKPHGIKVSGLYPGGVDTPMLRQEMKDGGSALNFINPPACVEDISNAFFKALKTGKLEVYSPYFDSVFARLMNAFPWMLSPLYPLLEWLGEKGKRKYAKRIDQSLQENE